MLKSGRRKSCLNCRRFLSKSQSLFFPVYKTLCLVLFQNFVPSSCNCMIPDTPERLFCSVLCSVAVPVQAFQQDNSACSHVPDSLFPFLPLYTAQGTAARCVTLCGMQELSHDAKQHEQLCHQLPFCMSLRERRSKQDEGEPVLCQGTET